MRRRHRHAWALRRRYGRAMGPQAITTPAGHGRYNVVLVDGRGTPIRTLARDVAQARARAIILSEWKRGIGG